MWTICKLRMCLRGLHTSSGLVERIKRGAPEESEGAGHVFHEPGQPVAQDSQDLSRATLELQAKLAEYETHRSEIQSRSDYQNRILQIHVTALGLIIGAVLTTNVDPWLLLIIPVESLVLGLWFFDHAYNIELIGRYIASEIEPKIDNRILKRKAFLHWETGYRTPMRTRSKLSEWTTIIIASFVIPAVVTVIGAFYYLYPEVARRGELRFVSDSTVNSGLRGEETTHSVMWLSIRLLTLIIVFFLGVSFHLRWRAWQLDVRERAQAINRSLVLKFISKVFSERQDNADLNAFLASFTRTGFMPAEDLRVLQEQSRRLRDERTTVSLRVSDVSDPGGKQAVKFPDAVKSPEWEEEEGATVKLLLCFHACDRKPATFEKRTRKETEPACLLSLIATATIAKSAIVKMTVREGTADESRN